MLSVDELKNAMGTGNIMHVVIYHEKERIAVTQP